MGLWGALPWYPWLCRFLAGAYSCHCGDSRKLCRFVFLTITRRARRFRTRPATHRPSPAAHTIVNEQSQKINLKEPARKFPDQGSASPAFEANEPTTRHPSVTVSNSPQLTELVPSPLPGLRVDFGDSPCPRLTPNGPHHLRDRLNLLHKISPPPMSSSLSNGSTEMKISGAGERWTRASCPSSPPGFSGTSGLPGWCVDSGRPSCRRDAAVSG